MSEIFSAKNYREIVELNLRSADGQNRRGVSKLAAHLKVHPTFISKMLDGNADFSMEQSVVFAQYANLSEAETEFFIDLVNHDRAGNTETKKFFAARLRRHLTERNNLHKRLRSSRSLEIADQVAYYDTWIPQAIHALCQTMGRHSAASIANHLRISKNAAIDAISKLKDMELLRENGDFWVSTELFVHTGKDSPLINRLHLNWRQKTIQDLLSGHASDGLHFSGVASIDISTAEKIEALLVNCIQSTKSHIAASPSEKIYAISLDFYGL